MTTHHSSSPARDTAATRALVVTSIALFTDMLVHGLAVPVLPLLPAVANAGPAATGFLFSSYAIAMVIATLFAGRIVDQYGAKTPMLIGMVGLAAATLLFAVGGPYWLLLLARFAQGIAGGMSWVAGLSLIAATTSFEKRGQAMGTAMSTITLGTLVGPPLAGFMVEHLGTASPFLLAAAIAIIDGILRLTLITASPRVNDDPAGPLTILRVPGSYSIITVVAIGAGLLSAIEPVLPVHLGASSITIGLLFGLASLTAIIANPVVGRYVATAPRALIALGIIAAAGSLLLIGWATETWQTFIGMGILGLSSALLLAPATTLMSEQGFAASPPGLGGTFALYNLAYAGGLALGPLLAGVGVQHGGFTTTLSIGAAVFLLGGAIAIARLPQGSSPTTRYPE